MFGSAVFLGQYFQIARGYSATESGLLTIPMMLGSFFGSVGAGQMITRFGKWKRYLVLGGLLLIAGLGVLGTIDHTTAYWYLGGRHGRDGHRHGHADAEPGARGAEHGRRQPGRRGQCVGRRSSAASAVRSASRCSVLCWPAG